LKEEKLTNDRWEEFRRHVIYPVLVILSATFIIFVARIIWVETQPQKIDLSPEFIIKQLFETDNYLRRYHIAEQIYFGKYVEWEITIDKTFSYENNAAIIKGAYVKAIFKNSSKIVSYEKGMTLVVKGRIVDLENAIIVIDKCKIVGLK